MRWMVFFIFVMCMAASARSNSQTVRLNGKSMTLPALFKAVRSQTGYVFAYGEHVLDGTKEVHLPAGSLPLNELLDKALHPQGLQYSIESKTIVVTKAPAKRTATQGEAPVAAVTEQPQETIRGRVVDSLGNPLPGATVKVRGTNITAIADKDGSFTLETAEAHPVLEISYIGYQTATINGSSNTLAVLHEKYSELDETIMMAYGKTSRRYNTGNISKVTAKEIEEQPVGNVLQALQGRVPGLNVTTTSGVPGSSVKIQVRGQNSIIGGNDPLILIDGVPFGPNNNDINMLSSAISSSDAMGQNGGGLSAFNSINPMDIESIEVLKDGDATAIYGSRGANGVILITTKKGKTGTTKFNFNIYNGISKATRLPKMMNTQQYLTMRHEAFNNDGETPTQDNAPDLMLWDTSKYTDFTKEYLGGTPSESNITGSISGGSANTQYLISGTYRDEQNIYSHNFSDKRGTIYSSINTTSDNKKFSANLNTSYTYDNNNQISGSVGSFLNIAPNMPDLKDSTGNLVWYYDGINFQNPLYIFETKYLAQTSNVNGSLNLNYELYRGLTLRLNTGYNKVDVREVNKVNSKASNPFYGISRSAEFGNNNITSWNIEPQIEYKRKISHGNIDILAGSTWQSKDNRSSSIYATGQSSDDLLGSLSAASSTSITDYYSKYRYQAFWGRINYNWENKYLLNVTGRRDGSSRFGENHKFSNFGAVGAGWIFSNEQPLKENLSFLSFGKLRGSYGITGNDQIGDYQYLDSWQSTSNPYYSTSALVPARLANSDFTWEKNKKIEVGLEIGLFNDDVYMTASWYRNRSSNMLINYTLPYQTGFTTVLKNFPGLVQNTGWELAANMKLIKTNSLSWHLNGNLTIPKNKLLAFPDFENSTYSNTYIIGQSLSNIKGYKFTGVNPTTGLFSFQDSNEDGIFDMVSTGDLAPKYYGGIGSNLTFKDFQFDLFFEFKKQLGYNYLASVYYGNYYPGQMYGLYPVELLNRWKKEGDMADIQKLSQSTSSDAYVSAATFANSLNTGKISDASYIRLKTISLSYTLPAALLKKMKITQLRIYSTCQNLFTLTGYKVTDPETQNLRTLAPMKNFVWGMQLSF